MSDLKALAWMDGYLAGREDDEWRNDDEILALAEIYDPNDPRAHLPASFPREEPK